MARGLLVKNRRKSLFCSAIVALGAAQGGVVSRDWGDGKLQLKLDDGDALIEWISPTAFRVARWWGAAMDLSRIAHARVSPQFEDAGSTLTMRSRYLTVTVDRGDVKVNIAADAGAVTSIDTRKQSDVVEVRFVMAPDEHVFGLMGGTQGRLNIRGEKLERDRGLFFTNAGYGMYFRTPERCNFDMNSGVITGRGANSIEFFFYYGPAPKEILEQHALVIGQREVKGTALDLLTPDRVPKEATPLPKPPVSSWDALAELVRRLNQWSLSAVIYPALDVASFDAAPEEVKARARDLNTLFPIIYSSAGEAGVDTAVRAEWTPYLVTYLREAFDRGYPLIRPLPMQFWRDKNSDRQADVFMLGDEVLLAPVLDGSGRRKLDLPRGIWTDFHTNQEYRGSQSIEVDAPAGRVPMFVRNGWIVPLAENNRMELHYFPSLAAEFFLWEPDLEDNSQFHAAPADDFLRLEVESKRRRTYEWVLHHTRSPREVAEESGAYQRVDAREALRPGAWWHDDANNDLHLMLRAEPGTDRIVNIAF